MPSAALTLGRACLPPAPTAVELLSEARLRLLGPYRPTIEPLLRKLLTREPHRRPLLSGVAHLVTRAIAQVPMAK